MKRYSPNPWIEERADGNYVKYEDALALERKVAELERERDKAKKEADDWRKSYLFQQEVTQDIGRVLGAKVPYELVNTVARRRMKEIDQLQRQLNFAVLLINRRRRDTGRREYRSKPCP